MKERCFNLFLFIHKDMIRGIGAVSHDLLGTDEQKMALLQSRVKNDWQNAKRFKVQERFITAFPGKATKNMLPYAFFQDSMDTASRTAFFEEVLLDMGASDSPLMVISPVVDGALKIEGVRAL